MSEAAEAFSSDADFARSESAANGLSARLLSLVGTPSPKLHATLSVVQTLAKVSFGEFEFISANTLADLKSNFHSSSEKPRSVLLYADYPQPELVSMLVCLDAPVAICADDFVTLAHYSVVWRQFGGADAARFASMGLVNIEPLMTTPPPRSLIIIDGKIQLRELVADLAKLYRIPTTSSLIDEVLANLGEAGKADVSLSGFAARTTVGFVRAREILERRSPLENELIDFLAAQYEGIVSGYKLEALEWPPFALLRPDYPDRLTVGPIDLTGPARFIYYGPYFALPLGAWKAVVAIEVQACFSDNNIAIDIISGDILAIIRTKLPSQGVYSCEIYFEIMDSSKPVEIRMQLLTGAIEGVLMLRKVTLHRLNGLEEGDSDSGL